MLCLVSQLLTLATHRCLILAYPVERHSGLRAGARNQPSGLQPSRRDGSGKNALAPISVREHALRCLHGHSMNIRYQTAVGFCGHGAPENRDIRLRNLPGTTALAHKSRIPSASVVLTYGNVSVPRCIVLDNLGRLHGQRKRTTVFILWRPRLASIMTTRR